MLLLQLLALSRRSGGSLRDGDLVLLDQLGLGGVEGAHLGRPNLSGLLELSADLFEAGEGFLGGGVGLFPFDFGAAGGSLSAGRCGDLLAGLGGDRFDLGGRCLGVA